MIESFVPDHSLGTPGRVYVSKAMNLRLRIRHSSEQSRSSDALLLCRRVVLDTIHDASRRTMRDDNVDTIIDCTPFMLCTPRIVLEA